MAASISWSLAWQDLNIWTNFQLEFTEIRSSVRVRLAESQSYKPRVITSRLDWVGSASPLVQGEARPNISSSLAR